MFAYAGLGSSYPGRCWNCDEDIDCELELSGQNQGIVEPDSSFAGGIQEQGVFSGLIGRVILPDTRVPDKTAGTTHAQP